MKKFTGFLVTLLCLVFIVPGFLMGDPVKVVLWTSYRGNEKAALEEVAKMFGQKHPEIDVQILQVPHDAFADKITAAIPRGKGPDVFIFGHDRIGDWVAREALEPLGLWAKEDIRKQYSPKALEALTYEDALYGLPNALKCVTLIYNKKLVKTPPKTTDELIKLGKSLTDPSKNLYGLVYENGLNYYNAAWLYGFGGGIFDENDDPILNSAGNVKALGFIHSLLRKEKIMPEEITNTLVTALFNKGNAAMIISGPWFLGEIDSKIDFAVAPLPEISAVKGPAKPFLTVEALIMSAKCKHKKEAFEVIKYFSGPEAALVFALKGNQPVANLSAYKNAKVTGHPYIPVFKAQAEHAVPMPNIPEMRMVWTPMDLAIGKVLNSGVAPKDALEEAQKKVSEDVKRFRGE